MGLKKLSAKLAEYQERLAAGQAKKITPEHVERVLEKLKRKESELLSDLQTETDADKRDELDHKLSVARAHIERAEWLREELD